MISKFCFTIGSQDLKLGCQLKKTDCRSSPRLVDIFFYFLAIYDAHRM